MFKCYLMCSWAANQLSRLQNDVSGALFPGECLFGSSFNQLMSFVYNSDKETSRKANVYWSKSVALVLCSRPLSDSMWPSALTWIERWHYCCMQDLIGYTEIRSASMQTNTEQIAWFSQINAKENTLQVIYRANMYAVADKILFDFSWTLFEI